MSKTNQALFKKENNKIIKELRADMSCHNATIKTQKAIIKNLKNDKTQDAKMKRQEAENIIEKEEATIHNLRNKIEMYVQIRDTKYVNIDNHTFPLETVKQFIKKCKASSMQFICEVKTDDELNPVLHIDYWKDRTKGVCEIKGIHLDTNTEKYVPKYTVKEFLIAYM